MQLLSGFANEVIYGLVMLDQARIPRPTPRLAPEILKMLQFKDVLFGVFALTILALAAGFLSGPFSSRSFSSRLVQDSIERSVSRPPVVCREGLCKAQALSR